MPSGSARRMLHCAQPIPIPPTLRVVHPLQPLRLFVQPTMQPPRRRLLLFPFFQFGLGGGERACNILPSALNPRAQFPTTQLGFSLRSIFTPLRTWSAKGKISIFICFFAEYVSLRPPPPSSFASFSSFPFHLHLLGELLAIQPLSRFSRRLSVSPTVFVPLARFLPCFRPSPYLHPTTPARTALWRERQTRRRWEQDRGSKEEARR